MTHLKPRSIISEQARLLAHKYARYSGLQYSDPIIKRLENDLRLSIGRSMKRELSKSDAARIQPSLFVDPGGEQ